MTPSWIKLFSESFKMIFDIIHNTKYRIENKNTPFKIPNNPPNRRFPKLNPHAFIILFKNNFNSLIKIDKIKNNVKKVIILQTNMLKLGDKIWLAVKFPSNDKSPSKFSKNINIDNLEFKIALLNWSIFANEPSMAVSKICEINCDVGW